MKRTFTLNLNHMLKTSVACAALLSVVAIGLASSGGGKKKASLVTPSFTPIRSTGNFTLRSHPDYAGSQGSIQMTNNNSILYKSVVTYQKGNTIYILPSSYRINTPRLSFRSNLNVIDLKIRLNR